MKTADLGLAIAFLAATGFIATHAVATDVHAEPDAVAGRENNAPDEMSPPVQQYRARSAPTRIAEGGSDRLIERRVAEGGSDRLIERRVAEGGSDRLIERRVAEGGSDRLIERRVAEGGSDRLIERRVADVGNVYGSGMNINAHFSMD
ncbi:phage infection protein [Pseudomonas fluorescens]|nr:phage infection protein [Pseudomonas fluorescens]